jgi:hypothetical protein
MCILQDLSNLEAKLKQAYEAKMYKEAVEIAKINSAPDVSIYLEMISRNMKEPTAQKLAQALIDFHKTITPYQEPQQILRMTLGYSTSHSLHIINKSYKIEITSNENSPNQNLVVWSK